jgi:hypothetical protein
MHRLLLITSLITGLHAAEPDFIFKDKPTDWKMAGPGSFEIKGDIATAKGGMGLWWYGKKDYSNAYFELQFKTTDAKQNSGVFVRFPDPGNDPWVAVKQGYEIQISGTEPGIQSIGSIYESQAAVDVRAFVGEWNTYKIITAGDHICVILNDKIVNIFECQPGRGDQRGYLGLQNHDDGSPVQFRGVKVQELSSESLLKALEELNIPRAALTRYWNIRKPVGKKWYHATDHGPAFFQSFGDYYEGTFRRESAIKGLALSYSANPDRKALFNTETLALISSTDGGISLDNTPWGGGHGKVNQFKNKDNYLFNTSSGPVWADASGSFDDNRTIKGFGNFDHLKFNGYFRNGSDIILDYDVHGARILDLINENSHGISRFFEVTAHDKALKVRLSNNSSHKGFSIKVAGQGAALKNENGAYFLTLAPSKNTSLVSLNYTTNGATKAPTPQALSPMTYSGKGISPESFTYDLKPAEGKAAWLVDDIPLPKILLESPYHCKVRMSDVDFFSDGDRALLTTWDGDIWLASGLKEFKKITWKRYATGFFEPLGLRILKDIPYVAGRDAIWKLSDVNKDGEADKFEIFNNDVFLTTNFHEFQFGLETDAEGNFYFAKGSPVRPGGRGFDRILPHNGAFVKVSADGEYLEVIGTGLRAPGGIAIGPNGEITTGENEGTWQPCCKLNYYEPSRGKPFFGVENARHENKSPYTEPLCYLPMSVDNSGGGQIWVPEHAKIGIKSGELIHLSYGKSAIYHVLREKVEDGFYQGGVVKLPVKLASSAQRAVFNPDGSMYVAGFRGWQTNAAREAGFQRIRRNDSVANPLPSGMKVTKDGVALRFDVELDDELATDPSSFTVKRWKYIRSVQYGSGQFSVDHPDLEAEKKAAVKESKGHRKHDNVKVLAAKLLDDKKTILLKLDGHKPAQQVKIDYDLESADGDELIGNIHSTIHKVPAK